MRREHLKYLHRNRYREKEVPVPVKEQEQVPEKGQKENQRKVKSDA